MGIFKNLSCDSLVWFLVAAISGIPGRHYLFYSNVFVVFQKYLLFIIVTAKIPEAVEKRIADSSVSTTMPKIVSMPLLAATSNPTIPIPAKISQSYSSSTIDHPTTSFKIISNSPTSTPSTSPTSNKVPVTNPKESVNTLPTSTVSANYILYIIPYFVQGLISSSIESKLVPL